MQQETQEAIRHIVLGHLVNTRIEMSENLANMITDDLTRYLEKINDEQPKE